MNRKNRPLVYVSSLLVLLLIILLTLIYIREDIGEREVLLVQINDSLSEIEYNEIEAILDQEFMVKKYLFRGISLIDFLAALDVDVKKIRSVHLLSYDGAQMILYQKDLIEQNILFVWDLEIKNSLRIVFPYDNFEQRWLKYIAQLTIETF